MGPEDVADAADRFETLVIGIDFGAQARNDDVDDVGLGIEAIVPDVFEDHRLADGPARVAEEEGEKREFARLQLDALAGAGDLARDEVERDIAGGEARGLGRLRAGGLASPPGCAILPAGLWDAGSDGGRSHVEAA